MGRGGQVAAAPTEKSSDQNSSFVNQQRFSWHRLPRDERDDRGVVGVWRVLGAVWPVPLRLPKLEQRLLRQTPTFGAALEDLCRLGCSCPPAGEQRVGDRRRRRRAVQALAPLLGIALD